MRKGQKQTEETRAKMSKSHIGIVSPNKGKKLPKEWREKMSKSHIGLNTWIKGRKLTPEHKLKVAHHKENHWNWKGGVTSINETIRKSVQYKLWRTAVFERDNFTCIWGGKEHGNDLHADHIKSFSQFPELRFAIDNGRTLCVNCHRTTDNYGGRKNNG